MAKMGSQRSGVTLNSSVHDISLFTTFLHLENDIQNISKQKFKFENVVPVLEELNASRENKVILWYVSKFCIISKISKIWNIPAPAIIHQTLSTEGTRAPS